MTIGQPLDIVSLEVIVYIKKTKQCIQQQFAFLKTSLKIALAWRGAQRGRIVGGGETDTIATMTVILERTAVICRILTIIIATDFLDAPPHLAAGRRNQQQYQCQKPQYHIKNIWLMGAKVMY